MTLSGNWLLLYGLLTLLAWLVAWGLTPAAPARRRRFAGLLLGVIVICIPLFGSIIAIAWAFALRGIRRRAGDPEVEPIEVPIQGRDTRLAFSSAAPGGVAARLRSSAQVPVRLSAVAQLSKSRFAEQDWLLRAALSDRADEVRLLAYAALDRREQELTEMLIFLDEQLHRDLPPGLRQRMESYRLWLEWHQEHNAVRELRPAVGRAQDKGPELSAAALRASPSLALLQGLWQLDARAESQAESSFHRAIEHGLSASVVVPYLAQVQARQRHWVAVRDLWRSQPVTALSPRLGAVARYWQQGA